MSTNPREPDTTAGTDPESTGAAGPPPDERPGGPDGPPATPPSPAARPPAPSGGRAMSPDERNWAMFTHLAAVAGFVIPFGNILGPLVIWLIKKQDLPVIEQHGKAAVNFHITMWIGGVIAGLLVLILVGIPLLIALFIYTVVEVILNSIRASNGEPPNYRLSLKLIS